MFGEINIASSRKRIKSATRGCVSDAEVRRGSMGRRSEAGPGLILQKAKI